MPLNVRHIFIHKFDFEYFYLIFFILFSDNYFAINNDFFYHDDTFREK